jgi:transformer-2 protein
MYDPHSRESRGFGFVTMESNEEAEAAITALNATEFMGRVITVEKVRPLRHCLPASILTSRSGAPCSRPHPDARPVLRAAQAR